MGEALSLTLTYAAGLPSGALDIRTRRLRQGGSVGVWSRCYGLGQTRSAYTPSSPMAVRPNDPGLLAKMPDAPAPESLPSPEIPGAALHYGASAFERRTLEGFPPTPGGDSRSLAWVRSRRGPMDKAVLGMVTDNPRRGRCTPWGRPS